MKIIYLSIILLLSISFVSALGPVGEKGITVQVQNGTIIISGYTIIQDPSTGVNLKVTSDNLFINRVANSTGPIISCESIIVPILNGTYWDGSNRTITPSYNFTENYQIDLPFTSQNITNQSSLFCLSQDQYNQCLADKASYNAGLNSCVADKNKMNDVSNNFTTCQDTLRSTQTSLQICNSAKDTTAQTITDMTQKQKDTSNQIWIVGALCLAAGVGATMYYKGHWGNKNKDPDDNFNRTQAG